MDRTTLYLEIAADVTSLNYDDVLPNACIYVCMYVCVYVGRHV